MAPVRRGNLLRNAPCSGASDGLDRWGDDGSRRAQPTGRPTLPFFKPLLAGATLRDRIVACLCAAIGIALTIVACLALTPGGGDLPAIVAPLGASAVLVFAVPSSPLAQP